VVSLAERVSFHAILDYIAIVLGEIDEFRTSGISSVAQKHYSAASDDVCDSCEDNTLRSNIGTFDTRRDGDC
jgi:hypothetical protein